MNIIHNIWLKDINLQSKNIEINQDKKTVSEKISYLGFDEKYNTLLVEIDDFLNDDTHKIIPSAMISCLRTFMGDLNSSTPWDLIIVAAEERDAVQGEFWDVIAPKVINDKTALIVEMWYLSDTVNGRIRPLLTQCGIDFLWKQFESRLQHLIQMLYLVLYSFRSGSRTKVLIRSWRVIRSSYRLRRPA
jgi:hypothetical protein